MTGLTDLQKTLQSLEVACDGIEYGFSITPNAIDLDPNRTLATFVEDEGLTVIASTSYLTELGLTFEGPFAKLTIEVHTSLELVGLTAALSSQLTKDDISANVVAAFYHDHIFVQYDLKDSAIASISQLKNRD